ncbi:hypothetical protein [Polaromonas naphthalenivorans]|uniref:Molecular chaperone DnaJ n=1 Tax=Polaromonas naphthalenivorans (strain CJ2) TaxID=365044 RepID=A1VLV0_POLNA|nr:hypothetical protein [Polaromonas naphthalenivorans]ABM36628.1 hypothetical protein Pnap_1313 [Polaromonas naphthalenivorans CJ2]
MTEQPDPSPADTTGKAASPPVNSRPGMPAASPEPDDLDSQSVAGEEDPGASLEMFGASAGRPDSGPISAPRDVLNPGDEAPAGTPGTGEGICRECGGSGRVGDATCPSCKGSGKVIVGIGGA